MRNAVRLAEKSPACEEGKDQTRRAVSERRTHKNQQPIHIASPALDQSLVIFFGL
jgi:hypothetical protein